jgi:nicotinamidase-related amidase
MLFGSRSLLFLQRVDENLFNAPFDISYHGCPLNSSEDENLVAVKNTSNVFTSTSLEFVFLRNMGIEQLFVTDFVINMCVEGTARTAAEFGLDVFLIADACAAWSSEIHAHTLQSSDLFCRLGYDHR